MLAQQVSNGLSTGLVYGLLALGFSLAYSTTRVVNFAHGEFFAFGALLGISLQRGSGLAFLPASAVSVTLLTLAAALFAFFVLWWLRTPLQRSVATIAVSLGLRDVMLLTFGSDSASFPQAPIDGSIVVIGATIPRYAAFVSVWTFVLLLAFWFIVGHTRLGTWMRATAQDQELAATNGVAIRSVQAGAFALGASAAVAAGLLIGPSWQVSYSSGSVVGLKAFTSAMLGGLGRLDGAVAGGVLLGLAEALFAGYVSSAWKDLAVFWILLLCLLLLPRGIFALSSTRIGGGGA